MHPVLRHVLSRRALGSVDELELTLRSLVPVGRFDALEAAVELLCAHRKHRIVIVGDFDADGATSTALMLLSLRELGFEDVDYFIPDRFELGYGLSPGVVQRLAPQSPSLIVTVDNGISSLAGVAAARGAGIDVLVTDHHLPPAELPRANVIVNPNVPGAGFAAKSLAGVGVAFYLVAALAKRLGRADGVAAYLDLVALGTVADLVKLDHTNRILVEQGLRRVRAGHGRPGIRALCKVSGVAPRDLTASNLGYHLGPRLNAAGRLDDMSVGVRCLISRSDSEALALAAELDGLNRERREIEARMRADARALVEGIDVADGAALPPVLCLLREDWHEGLVGLVASRIKERHHRPTFAFAPNESGTLKGSGRSIPGFHLRDALAAVDAERPGLIERFGGHAMAAGLTLPAERLAEFEHAIGAVGERALTPELLAERIFSDGELAAADVNVALAALLRDSGPWGQGFPEPSFDGRFELRACKRLKDVHLKMSLNMERAGAPVDAIAFNRPDLELAPGARLRVVYRLAVNDYFSPARVQLIVEHLQEEVC
jgi:single-stranded-DNA-specific exonuclease